MSQNRLPPPQYEACLFRLRSSTQKGAAPSSPKKSPTTPRTSGAFAIQTAIGYPSALDAGDDDCTCTITASACCAAQPGTPVATIVRLVCVSREAIWQILPLFIARHLWRTWNVVRHALMPDHKAPLPSEPQHWPRVPLRTRRAQCQALVLALRVALGR